MGRLVIECGLIAGFSKILAEKLIRLCDADTEAAPGRRAALRVTPNCPARRLTEADAAQVCALMQGNPLFYRYHLPQPTPESIRLI